LLEPVTGRRSPQVRSRDQIPIAVCGTGCLRHCRRMQLAPTPREELDNNVGHGTTRVREFEKDFGARGVAVGLHRRFAFAESV